MKKRISAVLFLGIPCFLLAGEPGASFLAVDPSIRSIALGGVVTAAQGAQALGLNPAFLSPPTAKSELYASFSQLFGETTNGHLAFASLANPKQAWGLSATFINAGNSNDRDSQGQPTGTKTATHHETGAGAYSWEFWRGMHAGVCGNIYQSTLAGESSDVSWAIDTGVSLQTKKMLYSLSLNHLGPGIQYIDQRDPLPSVLQLDASWEPGPFTVLAGYHRSLTGSAAEGAVGFEYRVRALSLRAGLNGRLGKTEDLTFKDQSSTDQLLDNLTTGFGLVVGQSLRMDYAFKQSAPDWGPAHSLALTWAWGDPAPSPLKNVAKPTPSTPKPTGYTPPLPTRNKLGK